MTQVATASRQLLGGRAAGAFLRRHWQREALLVRHAIRGFTGMHTRAQLVALACRDDVESRLVVRERGRFTLAHGPFRKADLAGLPQRNWTLLVQGVNLHDDATDALMRRFAFVPYARLDDVMVSYAAPGGGVGPHFDAYDVFLLQGSGRRRWRYGRQRDLTLVPDAPLAILRNFTPNDDAVLAPGDMLYLPPHYAHDGVAVDACTTYSIGFRAAAYEELAQRFLDALRDAVDLPGRYADPDLRASRAPARIDAAMAHRIAAALAGLRWRPRDVARFVGAFLSEPKSTVQFVRPAARLAPAAFAAAIGARGVSLDRRTQLLYDVAAFYVNGEALPVPPAGAAALRLLANARALPAAKCRTLPAALRTLLHEWHGHGYLIVDTRTRPGPGRAA
ncbi:MAG: cupin domain-containing protein [Betaproteobacteria bacterium]